jgi:hypothetical protein
MDAGVIVDTCTGSSVGASTVSALEKGGTVDSHMNGLPGRHPAPDAAVVGAVGR